MNRSIIVAIGLVDYNDGAGLRSYLSYDAMVN